MKYFIIPLFLIELLIAALIYEHKQRLRAETTEKQCAQAEAQRDEYRQMLVDLRLNRPLPPSNLKVTNAP